MTHLACAHDKSVHFQLTLKILEFLPEGSGTGFLHKKRVPEIFPLPSSLRAACGAKETIHSAKRGYRTISPLPLGLSGGFFSNYSGRQFPCQDIHRLFHHLLQHLGRRFNFFYQA